MAQGERQRERLDPAGRLQQVQIGMAGARATHLQQHFPGPGSGIGTLEVGPAVAIRRAGRL